MKRAGAAKRHIFCLQCGEATSSMNRFWRDFDRLVGA
jgi:hypothetical protein